VLGGGALLAAAAVDFFAILGRHSGIPLLGSIELVQVLVGIAGTVALVAATLHRNHARVRVLSDRVGERAAGRLCRFNAICSSAFFLALAAGSAWLAFDLWSAQEASELWQLPYKPLRIAGIAGLLGVVLLSLRQARQGSER
jgi:TRAP-type C4-dicarboxylate transport system permease small subunit